MIGLDGMPGHSTIFPPVPFPIELVDLILSFVHPTDLKTISSCNIVCRQWYLFARPRLFCNIVFKPVEDSENTADSFLDLLRAESPTGPDSLATLVKSLTFVVNPPPTDYGEESVPHILPLLTNLTSLTISGYARLADIPEAISTSMRLTMSRVKKIELECLEFKSDVFEVFDLFSNPYGPHAHIPSHSIGLRELSLFNILPYSFMPSYDAEGTAMSPASSADLHTLSLTLNAMVMRAAITALVQSRTPVRLSQIVRLTMHTNSFITQTIRDVLAQMPELKYFGYSPGYLKRPCSSHYGHWGVQLIAHTANVNHYLPFETSPGRAIPHVALASTVMGEPPLQAVEIMRWWITQLEYPSRAFVGVNTLDLVIEEISFDSTDVLWSDLDRALALNVGEESDGAGGALEFIRITIPRVAANAVRRLFPMTNEKGVLCV